MLRRPAAVETRGEFLEINDLFCTLFSSAGTEPLAPTVQHTHTPHPISCPIDDVGGLTAPQVSSFSMETRCNHTESRPLCIEFIFSFLPPQTP
jgi:hypothetical protein